VFNGFPLSGQVSFNPAVGGTAVSTNKLGSVCKGQCVALYLLTGSQFPADTITPPVLRVVCKTRMHALNCEKRLWQQKESLRRSCRSFVAFELDVTDPFTFDSFTKGLNFDCSFG